MDRIIMGLLCWIRWGECVGCGGFLRDVLMRCRNNIEVVDKSAVLKDQGYPTGLV